MLPFGDVGTIIASIGFGSIISAFITVHYQKRRFYYEMKLNLYSKLIQSWNNIAGNPDISNHQNLESNLTQAILIGSNEVMKQAQALRDLRSQELLNNLIYSMRRDLNIPNVLLQFIQFLIPRLKK